jgi:hypothetical protein
MHESHPRAAAIPSLPDPHHFDFLRTTASIRRGGGDLDLSAPRPGFVAQPDAVGLARAMPSPGRSTMLGSPTKKRNKSKAKAIKRKDRHYNPKASPLASLRQRMARFDTFGKGTRRGLPASVLDYGGNGGGIAAGRGDESRFFPTIEEEDEEDWSKQLLPHHSTG